MYGVGIPDSFYLYTIAYISVDDTIIAAGRDCKRENNSSPDDFLFDNRNTHLPCSVIIEIDKCSIAPFGFFPVYVYGSHSY